MVRQNQPYYFCYIESEYTKSSVAFFKWGRSAWIHTDQTYFYACWCKTVSVLLSALKVMFVIFLAFKYVCPSLKYIANFKWGIRRLTFYKLWVSWVYREYLFFWAMSHRWYCCTSVDGGSRREMTHISFDQYCVLIVHGTHHHNIKQFM